MQKSESSKRHQTILMPVLLPGSIVSVGAGSQFISTYMIIYRQNLTPNDGLGLRNPSETTLMNVRIYNPISHFAEFPDSNNLRANPWPSNVSCKKDITSSFLDNDRHGQNILPLDIQTPLDIVWTATHPAKIT